ncbi:MAG: phage holin family protein [Candidatus Cloacimonetes bacterium]|nr:phage holin family protein [Candidatus Cloacimonadota bacterium]
MEPFILKIIILAISIFLVGKITRLYRVDDLLTALITALLLALVNTLVKPLIIILTLPLTILTLGLFLFIVNGISLLIVSSLFPRFKIEGCFTAALAAILISIVNSTLLWFLLL